MPKSYGKVYLSGGISDLTPQERTDWREEATYRFLEQRVDVLDPTRSTELEIQSSVVPSLPGYGGTGLFYSSRAIMVRDFNDVRSCDILLVNLLSAKTRSIGTIMELAWAYAFQKIAVVVIESTGNPHDNHPMLIEAMPFRVKTLQEGIDAVLVILGLT
jgi:nucleoside 2-deoxyribosyltransferase